VVHTHLGASDVLAGLAARSLGIPSVSTVHSLGTGADAPPTARARVRNRIYAMGTRASAARLVAVSESARREVLRRDGYAPERVVVINNGIARRPAPGAGPYVREQLGIGPDELVVATLSTLRPVKGHEVAIAAMAEITRRVPGARLVVVGEGESRPALERAAAELGPVVKFAGFRDDVMPVLDAFDVLAHPSRQEAFPTTLLEAMAAGVPQVATAVGGIPEIVEDGRTGLLMPAPPEPAELAERVVRLLRDPELRAGLAAAGRERFAERFGADAWAQRLRALYLEVLESR
jgi:glycosyltransferase involved in cell wall biosynthesis